MKSKHDDRKSRPEQLPPRPHSPKQEAMGLLLQATRMHHSEVERKVGTLGVHHSQHRMLMRLSRGDVTNSQRELADAMNISPAAVTATLKGLEKDGYITRSMGSDDNRRNNVCITAAGIAKVEESRRLFEAIDRQAFDGFSQEELETFMALLRRMIDNFRTADDKSGASDRP